MRIRHARLPGSIGKILLYLVCVLLGTGVIVGLPLAVVESKRNNNPVEATTTTLDQTPATIDEPTIERDVLPSQTFIGPIPDPTATTVEPDITNHNWLRCWNNGILILSGSVERWSIEPDGEIAYYNKEWGGYTKGLSCIATSPHYIPGSLK